MDLEGISGSLNLDIGNYTAGLDHAVEAGETGASELSGSMESLSAGVSGPLREAFEGVSEAIAGIVSQNPQEFFRGLATAVGGVTEMTESVISGMARLAGASNNGIAEMFKGIGDAIQGIISENPGEVLKGIGEALAGLYENAEGVAERFHEIGLAAEKAGTDVEWMSGMEAVGERANIGVESLVNGFKILEQRAELAGEGNEEAIKGFARLGISAQEAAGLMDEPQKLFERVQQSIGSMQNPSERTAAALGVLGRAGFNLVPILSKSSDEIERMKDLQEELHANVTEKDEQMGQSFKEMTTTFSEAWQGIENAIATPVLEYVQDHLTDIVQGVKDFAEWARTDGAILANILVAAFAPLLEILEDISAVMAALSGPVSDLLGMDTGSGGSSRGYRGTNPNADGNQPINIQNLHVHNEAGDSVNQLADKLKQQIRENKAANDAEIQAAGRQRAIMTAVAGGAFGW
jgi:hypothetical protein